VFSQVVSCRSATEVDCNVLLIQDDDDNMYTSIQELRDEADELQQTMDDCEKRGDVTQLEQLQQKLQQTQSKLLEKNEERHLARYFELSNLTSTGPHLRCDVGLEEGEYRKKELSPCIVYYCNVAQRYEQFLQVG